MDFANGKELLACCHENDMPISRVMIEREITVGEKMTAEEIKERMKTSLDIMLTSAKKSIEMPTKSIGGLIGGEAKKVKEYNGILLGDVLKDAVAYSQSVLEVNATMGLIVAAPTAGSSGVMPGAITALKEHAGLDDETLLAGLFNAGALGYLFMRNASVAGAEGGCQAEVGAASAMAASSVTEMLGGTPEECLNAASLAISNILGLVCDPIAGLVESPCQSRNAIGVANAYTSATLSMAGAKHPIPFDEMLAAMYEVGTSLPNELRETALGGCAACPTGCKLTENIFGDLA